MKSNWTVIEGVEKNISAVTQTHEAWNVKSAELVQDREHSGPVYVESAEWWEFYVRLRFENSDMTVVLTATDRSSGPNSGELVIDESTYSYGPVDYLTVFSNGKPVIRLDAEE